LPECTFTLYTSNALLDELDSTLRKPKFVKRLGFYRVTAAQLVARYVAIAALVEPTSTPRVVPNDADDDHVVAAAVAAQADFLISGNTRHFVPLTAYNGITVLTVRQVMEKILNQP
jgi:uncharacterized protein